jgi:hypothetical protein
VPRKVSARFISAGSLLPTMTTSRVRLVFMS